MQFEQTISDYLKVDQEGFICFSGKQYLKPINSPKKEKALILLTNLLNKLGQKSSKSQHLPSIITCASKFNHSDQRIYIKVSGNKALGFVKVGEKHLFYRNYAGLVKQILPTCVLDIYVHQSCQRTGVGKEIFQKFIKTENRNPENLAYDKPSPKLISFLNKHYGLKNFLPQNNNYVIFDRYFQKSPQKQLKKTTPLAKLDMILNMKTKDYQEDSLSKLTKEMNNLTFQPTSHKIIKDQTKSSFGCPWAIEQKAGFKTSSNTYGFHYSHRNI